MYAPKQRDPEADRAIQAFLANGGQITVCRPAAHGECKQRKGIQFRGSRADNPIDEGRIELERRSRAACSSRGEFNPADLPENCRR